MKRKWKSEEQKFEEKKEFLELLPPKKYGQEDRLTDEGVEIAYEALRQNLVRTEKYLKYEVYICPRPVSLCLAPCSQLRWNVVGVHEVRRNLGTTEVPRFETKLEPRYKLEFLGEVQGVCYLLCASPACGGPPYDCPVHWLEGRKLEELKGRRLKKEFRRALKKGH